MPQLRQVTFAQTSVPESFWELAPGSTGEGHCPSRGIRLYFCLFWVGIYNTSYTLHPNEMTPAKEMM